MAILPINVYGCDILKKKTKPVKDITDDTIKILVDMVETLKNANGVGLAANQVGIPFSLAVIDLSGVPKDDDDYGFSIPDEFRKPTIIFNPEITKSWDEDIMEESCLSIPDVRVEVPRAEFIKMRYRDADFNEQTLEAEDWFARVLQHEIDHLNGKLILDRSNRIKTALMRKRLKKIENGEYKPKYPVKLK